MCSNSQLSQSIQHYHQEASEIYKLARANKNMPTEHGLYSTINVIHNGYCLYIYIYMHIKRQTEIAHSSPWSVSSNAESCNM